LLGQSLLSSEATKRAEYTKGDRRGLRKSGWNAVDATVASDTVFDTTGAYTSPKDLAAGVDRRHP
jgi:hypothetical protein